MFELLNSKGMSGRDPARNPEPVAIVTGMRPLAPQGFPELFELTNSCSFELSCCDRISRSGMRVEHNGHAVRGIGRSP